ncbi:hypothetical protein IMCC21906_01328 [Spongiibacter sp. IMCC21906]|jgi:hypothetical protein|uniref:DUF2333 family protein n=1 Tax=Spongiibacter sp. IMCC21906 TaxID=1620392 RepID=UPI00062DEFE0|nr:DUF2333 family protein [Spongiibacter sp. IMCC21906]AKH69006.1 hypothetical protein IMCC21906_01328 [Spongiibacter sp. IMCC21906]
MALAKVSAFFQGIRESLHDRFGDALPKVIGGVLLVYLLVISILGIYWSFTPDPPETQYFQQDTHSRVVGAATTSALIDVAETMLNKPGGFISNDITPPGLFMDNMPAWEYGVLIQVRDLSRAMRESFSRSQSQSQEDVDLAKAEPRFNFSNNSWAIPASESEYRQAIKHLKSYRDRLNDAKDPDAQFYSRADNLRYWLTVVESRMGSLSQRLSASVGRPRLNTDLANDPNARQSTPASSEKRVKTPWLKIDDVFYEAKGSSWALMHFLKAVEVDFADVLKNKNATVSLRQIIRELEGTQQSMYSPMILNGTGFGLLANHSLVMGSYISRANAAIIDLRDLLSQG